MSPIEPFSSDRPSLRGVLHDLGPVQLATGFVAFLFAATGPLAIILSVGQQGGLTPAQMSSFVFGVFAINGMLTALMTWAYRTPIAMFWTIPGTVLMGPALTHLSYPEIIGAFYATSLLVLVLGWTGLARRALAFIPMPIVMAMVAALFLKFGIDVVRSLHQDIAIAGTMVVAFFGLMASPALAQRMPPLIGALIVGGLAALMSGGLAPGMASGLQLVQPIMTAPVFSLAAMAELVLPFAITILLVQNGQGLAVMSQSDHKAPLTAITLACGIGGIASAMVGAVGTALTGPTAGLITSAGPRDKHYATAMVTALLAILFGLMAPTLTQLMLSAPKALILTLGSLAMLRVLLGSFTTAFKGPFSFGALTCFIVTVSDLPLLNIGAAFWGLVAGLAVSGLIERADFRSEA